MGAEKKRSPGSAAKRGTLEEFLTSVEENPEKDWRSFLFWALHNKDLTARVGIVDWMLDHGNPSLPVEEQHVHDVRKNVVVGF